MDKFHKYDFFDEYRAQHDRSYTPKTAGGWRVQQMTFADVTTAPSGSIRQPSGDAWFISGVADGLYKAAGWLTKRFPPLRWGIRAGEWLLALPARPKYFCAALAGLSVMVLGLLLHGAFSGVVVMAAVAALLGYAFLPLLGGALTLSSHALAVLLCIGTIGTILFGIAAFLGVLCHLCGVG